MSGLYDNTGNVDDNGIHDIRRVNNPTLYNPYKSQRSHLFRLKGSVIPNVFGSSLLITIFTTAVVILFEKTNIKLSIPVSLITVLGLVVGLLLTYRTNTAYDR